MLHDVHSENFLNAQSIPGCMDGGIKGQVISGKFGEIIARQRSGQDFELGEILVC